MIRRGKIFFLFDAEAHRFRLRWCQIEIDGVIKVWDLHTDFQTVLDTIAYAKNLVLEYLTDNGRAWVLEQVEWWIKGDSTYYCPKCMNALSHEVQAKGGPAGQDILCLRCDQCQTEVYVPTDAFAFERSMENREDTT